MSDQTEKPKRRGFAAMTPERKREIASLGGKAAWAQGKAHRLNGEKASEAGRKGGLASKIARQKAPPVSPAPAPT